MYTIYTYTNIHVSYLIWKLYRNYRKKVYKKWIIIYFKFNISTINASTQRAKCYPQFSPIERLLYIYFIVNSWVVMIKI